MFDEVRFPEDISYGALGGPEFFTDIYSSINGFERRNINWSRARARYNVSYGIKSKEQIENITEFFYARMGKAIGFRFKDWMDYSAVNEILHNKSQLTKTYKSGDGVYVRIITKPIKGTVTLYLNSEVYDGKFDIDYTTGKISFINLPDGVLTSNFEFDVPVRFDTDYLSVSIDEHNVYSCNDINLLEIK